ncbi:MAG: MBL fold metallo-hydrolase [Bacteroidota bacterium]
MKIEQFYDKGLAHGSYAIVSEGQMAVIDPARNPQPYYDFAKRNNAVIVAVFETHPHADFVSSHLEISKTTGAKIYVSKLLGAEYPHIGFDDGDSLQLGTVKLKAINTPGHSPDSVTILLEDENGKQVAAFTGDTLFVGDVGRPDLRESVGNITAKREELARMMYKSTREKLMKLNEDVLVYPAHGPGSLCGKGMSSDLYSDIGKELRTNYALQPMNEDDFVKTLLENQPFIPKYFGYDVEVNKKGADNFEESLKKIKFISSENEIEKTVTVVDARNQNTFKKGHLQGAFNIPNGGKFETWLGSIISPNEKFYLIAENESALNAVLIKSAKIGYEKNVAGALAKNEINNVQDELLNVDAFAENQDQYTIIDARNWDEIHSGKPFPDSLEIPLPDIRDRIKEIPTNKPIVIHCAGGYRSAIAGSIVNAALSDVKVFDLSEGIKNFPVQV